LIYTSNALQTCSGELLLQTLLVNNDAYFLNNYTCNLVLKIVGPYQSHLPRYHINLVPKMIYEIGKCYHVRPSILTYYQMHPYIIYLVSIAYIRNCLSCL